MTKEENKKRKKRLITIIIILIILIILLSLYSCTCKKVPDSNLEVSKNQTRAVDPNLKHTQDDQYFELVGFGQLQIDSDNQYINMINPSDNSVYLSFDVIYNDETLYSTKLIEPGNMEQFNIYSLLDAGTQTISYLINVYDITDMEPLWTGIEQKQELLVKK
ncbi:MAG: hypothetical protein Q4E99_06235 [Bacillota bacterium]|nr:hypothetical protein [Bacillota bacterium]